MGKETGVKAQKSFDTMCTLLRDLNIPISESKLTPPTTKIVCLDIKVHSERATLSVPVEKLEEILQSSKCFVTRRQLQTILGRLMFVHKVVKPARYIVNRLLHTLCTMGQDKAPMTEAIQKHINWFLVFVKSFNGTATYMHDNFYCPELIELDACLSGIGAVAMTLCTHISFKTMKSPQYLQKPTLKCGICWLPSDYGGPCGRANIRY